MCICQVGRVYFRRTPITIHAIFRQLNTNFAKIYFFLQEVKCYADSVFSNSFLVAPNAKNILIISSRETLESACSTLA